MLPLPDQFVHQFCKVYVYVLMEIKCDLKVETLEKF